MNHHPLETASASALAERAAVGTDEPARDVAGAAEFLCVSESYLNRLRVTGDGPAFVKLGKRVSYRMSDLRAWQATRVRTSTSEAIT